MTRRTAHSIITSASSLTWRSSAFGLGALALSSVLSACSEGAPVYSSGGSTASGGVASGGGLASGGASSGGSTTSGGAASGGAATSGGAASGGSATSGGAASGGSAAGGGTAAGGSASGGSAAGGGTAAGGSASGGGGSEGPPFSEVAAIIGTKCGTAMCHGKTPPTGGISLKNDDALYDTLMGKGAIAECGGSDLIEPNDGDGSSLIKLVMATECMKSGNVLKMPPMGAALPPADIATIKAWIDAGAKE